ncbi:MAG: hypothetical protein CSA81_07270 [Acidobacteria bacterium]|nr:MAG: hypothetical protein CSA81_07270 [Acidobacteriota bacterium]PIE91176.1 MAG: hypothetical protein CR997_02170 [Acidobacteriota bacterium]
MKWFLAFFKTSIGKKQLMAITGLFLSIFIIVHLVGNFTLFMGAETFNEYAKFYADHPKLLLVAEAGLVTIFLVHILLAFNLTLENKAARPQSYAKKDASDATLASRTMIYSGAIVLVFLVWHLIVFKFGPHHTHPRGLYGVVSEAFQIPWIGSVSVIAMLLLGFHLNHGIQSVIQTFGVEQPKLTPLVNLVGLVLSLFIGIGFAIIPLFFLFKG